MQRARNETQRIVTLSLDMITTIGANDGCFKTLNPAWEQALGYTPDELIGRPFSILVHPDDMEVTNAEAAKLAFGAKTISFRNRNRAKDGSYHWMDWNAVGSPEDQLLYCVARDVTEAKKIEEQIRTRATELETVAKVSASISKLLNTDELLQSVADLVKANFNLYHAHIYLFDEASADLVLAAGAGEVGHTLKQRGHRIPLDREHSIVAACAQTHEGVIVNDVTQTADFFANPLLPDTKSEMAIPMLLGDKLIGVLDVQSEKLNRFTDQDVYIKTILAEQIAVAVENARALTETQRARNETQRIITLSLDMITTIGANDGCFKTLNPAWEEVLGYSFDELIGHPFIDFVHPDDVHATNAESAKLASGVKTISFRNRYLAKDGSYRWIDWNAVGSPEDQMLYCVARDVTEAKKIEEQTRTRATEMETVAKVSAAATTILDLDELLQTVADLVKLNFNLYHAHIYLFDEDSASLVLAAGAGEVGRTQRQRGHRIPLNREHSLVARCARTREGVIANDVTQTPDFLANPLPPDTKSEMAVPLVVGDVLVGVLDVQADITDRFTEADVRVKTTLGDQIAVAIQNATLYQKQVQMVDQLQTVDRLKSEFLASMSHELRTPLNSIIGYSRMLLDGANGDLGEETNEDMDAIYNSGQHLLHMINDILDLAKIEAEALELDLEPVDFKSVTGLVVQMTSILLQNKPVQLALELDPHLTTLWADDIRLSQIMNNLIGNAIKFTNEGEICISAQDRNGMALIGVRDSGIGIAPDHLERIFERFQQADNSSTRRAGGTGLGLTITKHLIELHGGTIWVESTLGEHTTFWFTIPLSA